MQISDFITLTILITALITSAVTAFEDYRQNKNSIRPVLVVLEKLTDNSLPKSGYTFS